MIGVSFVDYLMMTFQFQLRIVGSVIIGTINIALISVLYVITNLSFLLELNPESKKIIFLSNL